VQLLDYSARSPEENLALDEALLEAAEAGHSSPMLRFWESSRTFIALGYTNRAAIECDVSQCARRNIPILRRVTGGGTVMQGPGCLSYALVQHIESGDSLNVGATNDTVMEAVRRALNPLLNGEVERHGHTDLTWRGRKFSGNAQKRKARHFLFHGTILLDFDVELVQRCLRPPSKQPDYRASRNHLDFIGNVPLEREAVKIALALAFGATEISTFALDERTRELVREKYARPEWNEKF